MATTTHRPTTLVTTSAVSLNQGEQLYLASRPLPGRLIGRATLTGGCVYAVPATDVARALELDGQPLTVVTSEQLHQLRLDRISAAGFDPAEHTPEETVQGAAELGVRLTRIDPNAP